MHISIRILVLMIGIVFIWGNIRLLIAKKITERYSIFWLIGCVLIFIIAFIPNLLDSVAGFLQIEYPPTLLFLVAILLVFWICLYNSVNITILKRQIVELTQQKAVADVLEDENSSHKLEAEVLQIR